MPRWRRRLHGRLTISRPRRLTNDIARVLLFGGGSQSEGVGQQLRDRMHVDVEIANPFNEIDTHSATSILISWRRWGRLRQSGVGLALRTVGDR